MPPILYESADFPCPGEDDQESEKPRIAPVHVARQVGAAGYSRILPVKRLHERYARAPELVAMFLGEARLVARIR